MLTILDSCTTLAMFYVLGTHISLAKCKVSLVVVAVVLRGRQSSRSASHAKCLLCEQLNANESSIYIEHQAVQIQLFSVLTTQMRSSGSHRE